MKRKYRLIAANLPNKSVSADDVNLFNSVVEELESSAYGTPTISLPFKAFNDGTKELSDPALASAIATRYWKAQRPWAEQIMVGAEEVPEGFPEGALGFALFDPNAPIFHPFEYREILAMSDDELRKIPPVKVGFYETELWADDEERQYDLFYKPITVLGHPYLTGIDQTTQTVAFLDGVYARGYIVEHPFLWNSTFRLVGDDAALFIDFLTSVLAGGYDGVPFSTMVRELRRATSVVFRAWRASAPTIDRDFQAQFARMIEDAKTQKPKSWRLFGSPNAVSHKNIGRWVTSVISGPEHARFMALRKQVQRALGGALLEAYEIEPEAAFGAVLLLSGRGCIPEFARVSEHMPSNEQSKAVVSEFKYGSPTSEMVETAALACGIEVANEALQSHYGNALAIADWGIGIWPQTAELWRQRGIIHLAMKHFGSAYRDLMWASLLNPALPDMEGPLDAVRSGIRRTDVAAPPARPLTFFGPDESREW